MDKEIEIYKEEKSLLLENYKDLIVNYEDSRSIYESIINEYMSTDSTTILCSRIVAYLIVDEVVEWSILLTTGKTLYKSKQYFQYETFIVDLKTIFVTDNTEFYLVAATKLGNITSSLMTYKQDSNAIAYYSFEEVNTLQFIGTIPLSYTPNSNPYLKCSEITINIDLPLISKFELVTVDGIILYESRDFDSTAPFVLNLGATTIPSDTVLVIKSTLLDGVTTSAELLIQCTPENTIGVTLDLIGTSNKPLLMYTGTYTAIPISTIKCSGVVGYVTGALIPIWAIILLDGTTVYTSDRKAEWDTCILDIATINLAAGTRFRIKCVNPGDDTISNEILEYIPKSATVYYELHVDAAAPYYKPLYYRGIIYSGETPPVLKCSNLKVFNDSLLIARYALLNNSGMTVYASGKHYYDYWHLDLGTLNLPSGTQLRLKANCIAGADSTAYMIIEYDPTVSYHVDTATFTLDGNAFKTVMIFKGAR